MAVGGREEESERNPSLTKCNKYVTDGKAGYFDQQWLLFREKEPIRQEVMMVWMMWRGRRKRLSE